MKFYCVSRLLDRVEDQYELLCSVTFDLGKRWYIKRDIWGSGWIYEADESFRSWCVVAYGFQPVVITDQEFYLLNIDGIAFIGRERTEELRKSMESQLNLLEQMKFR